MPRFDGNGPIGLGPISGRGMGLCNRRGVRATRFISSKNELAFLEEEERELERELGIIREEKAALKEELK